jgi:diguanylate cyclase (GGDEF)-like protein
LSDIDNKALFSQLPASLLCKNLDSGEIFANEACLTLFDAESASEDFLKHLKIYDAESCQLLEGNTHPFVTCAQRKSSRIQVRMTSRTRNLSCVILGNSIHFNQQDWVVLDISSVQDNDLTSPQAENSPLSNHLIFNRLLSGISSQLINVNTDNLDSLIEESLEAFGVFCGVDRCYLFRFSENKEFMDNTHEWVAPGVQSFKADLQGVTTDDLPYFNEVIRREHVFKVADVSDLPLSAALEKQEFERERIRAVLCVAVHINGELFGFIGCDILGTPYQWREHDVRYLKLIGEVLSNTLKNLSNRLSLERVTAQLESANKQLTHLANSDGLTGIANRRQFDKSLKQAIDRGIRERKFISLLMIDVDHFKRFNDTYGHNAGDKALKKVASTLSACCFRTDDLAARYGGEEFAVVLPETSEEQAQHVANKIMHAISALGISFESSPDNDALTVSIGIATQTCSKTLISSDLITLADKALYLAKNKGRNRIAVY